MRDASITKPHFDAADFRLLLFFRDLYDLLTTAEAETLGGTSSQMAVRGWHGGPTQISRSLKELEAKLGGVTLVYRSRGRQDAKPTVAGHELYHRIRTLDHDFRGCLRSPFRPAPVVIGLTTTIATLYLPFVLARSRWLNKHGQVELVAREYEWEPMTHELGRGGVHFAVGPFLPAEGGFSREPLYRMNRVLLAPRQYRKLANLPRRPAQWADLEPALRHKTLFALPPGRQPNQSIDPLLDAVPTLRRVELPSQVEIVAYVRHGLGVGLTSARYTQPWERGDDLLCVDVTHLLGTTDVYLYTPGKPRLEQTAPVRDLIDAFRAYTPATREVASGGHPTAE